MGSINFYHLTRSSLEGALYQLLSKAYQSGHTSVVRLANEEDVKAYDTTLWTQDPAGFLPHGTKGAAEATDHPIYLTDDDGNDNKAEFAFILPEATDENLDYYERVFVLFEGSSEVQVKEARSRWKALKDKGFDMAYWTQDDQGKWSQKKL